MTLEEFVAVVVRDRPPRLTGTQLQNVHPKPWVLRSGSGKDARIRMFPGGAMYERRHGATTWRLVDRDVSTFDLNDEAA